MGRQFVLCPRNWPWWRACALPRWHMHRSHSTINRLSCDQLIISLILILLGASCCPAPALAPALAPAPAAVAIPSLVRVRQELIAVQWIPAALETFNTIPFCFRSAVSLSVLSLTCLPQH